MLRTATEFLFLILSKKIRLYKNYSLLIVLLKVITYGLLQQTEPAFGASIPPVVTEQEDGIRRSNYSRAENLAVKGISCNDLLGACSDIPGFEAIVALHRQLDDDANGNVDITESDEFLRDELHYENGYERQKSFHGNDKYISMDELWRSWKLSEVHNWTLEDTIDWLITHVELPQYIQNFQKNAVDGLTLPRMAINDHHFVNSVLGIKDPIHKQKIVLKAMDVVLFGPPRYHNYVKDILLVLSLVLATGGCWFAYIQHKLSQRQLQKMMRDMQSLQQAEETLLKLQQELYKARQEQKSVVIEKQDLEKKLQDEIANSQSKMMTMKHETSDLESVQQLRNELDQAQEELYCIEKALETSRWSPPPALQLWLQLTHELELRSYNEKRATAEQQLNSAKEECEKLRKRRSTLLGAFRIAHGSSVDAIDHRILQAKAALSEVTKDLQERLYRWKQIERLCSFAIVHNPGLKYLESKLQNECVNELSSHPYLTGKLNHIGSKSQLLDEDGSSCGGTIGAVHQLVHNSAVLFLSPIPPLLVTPINEHSMLKLPSQGLIKQDSSTSLISAGQLSAFLASDYSSTNGAITSVAPSFYSQAYCIQENSSTQIARSKSDFMMSLSTDTFSNGGGTSSFGDQMSHVLSPTWISNGNMEQGGSSKGSTLNSAVSSSKPEDGSYVVHAGSALPPRKSERDAFPSLVGQCFTSSS
ncbi:stromal interaction molecule homolog isoform X2 [Limulus polyphemus]|uniref:Stromal interaction molecule homolog isoform X2 n=1 Tax=Limulus polyphemus TaxID=6850 RepID=A0ABM1S8Q4_LIMPO|nr:stromal interaction molecule homolog isoform X2 [Limulus polyphemus]